MIAGSPSASAFQRGMKNHSAVPTMSAYGSAKIASASLRPSQPASRAGSLAVPPSASTPCRAKRSAYGASASQRLRASPSVIVHPPRPPP